jgi:hypothetical protein
MKTEPKEVICPICGEKMFARNWGIQRQVYRGFGNEIVCAGESENYVSYDCSCGCQLNYKGRKDCWKKHECKCKCKSCTRTEFQSEFDNDDND